MPLPLDSIINFVAAAAAVTAVAPTWSQWLRKMWGRKVIQTALLAIVAAALVYDGIDRAGFLWPSPSEVAAARAKAEATVQRQAQRLDEQAAQIADLQQKLSAVQSNSGSGAAVSFKGNQTNSRISIDNIESTGTALEFRGNMQGSSFNSKYIKGGVRIAPGGK